MPKKKTRSELVRETRERLGLSQDAFSQRFGIGKGTVVRLEQGEARPQIGTLRALSKATGVDWTELADMAP